MKIALLCSKGGHLEEMMNIKDAWSRYDHYFITYRCERTEELDEDKVLIVHPFSSVPKFVIGLFRAFFKICTDKPDVVISTGMGWTDIFVFPFCKLIGSYTIYIESAANVDYISGTAKLVRHFCDRFLVQWKDLADKIGAEYHGGVF